MKPVIKYTFFFYAIEIMIIWNMIIWQSLENPTNEITFGKYFYLTTMPIWLPITLLVVAMVVFFTSWLIWAIIEQIRQRIS